MLVINVEKWDTSKEIANMMEINPLSIIKYKGDSHLSTAMILWWEGG